jgi:acyl-ACP thioesterase
MTPENSQNANEYSQDFLKNLSSLFSDAKKDVGNMAGRLAKGGRRMLARLRRVSKRANGMLSEGPSDKTPDAVREEIAKIRLKTEKYSQRKKLETSKTGKNGILRPVSMMNELQAIADIHATLLGAGRSFCLSNNIAWVVTHYIVDIIEMPDDKEELTFETWPAGLEALKAVRDFYVFGADGRPMIRATSQWIMIDMAARRPVRLEDHLPGWRCVPKRAVDAEFGKLADFEAENGADFDVRYDDIDVNQHVNNSVYALWATESLGFEWLDSHRLRKLSINFKKEIPADVRSVKVAYSIDGNTTRHTIKTGDITNAVVVCEWE